MVRWLRIPLPMQRTQAQSLVGERRAHVLWGSFLGTSLKTQHRKKRKGSKVRSNSGLDQEIRKASLEMTQV